MPNPMNSKEQVSQAVKIWENSSIDALENDGSTSVGSDPQLGIQPAAVQFLTKPTYMI